MQEVEKKIDETTSEATQEVEAVVTEEQESVKSEEAVEESTPEVAETPTESPKKVKKHHIAKQLVAEAKEIVAHSDSEVEECRVLLESDLSAYNSAKEALRTQALEQSETHLKELGFEPLDEAEDRVVFEPNEEILPVELKDVSSGAFTALLLALIVGAVTLVGMVYVAAQKLQLALDFSKVPEVSIIEQIAGWYAQAVGYSGDASLYVGASVVGAVVLLLMVLTYAIRVTLKGNKNLHFAEQQLEEAKTYVSRKASCKEEMERVDAHIKDAIATLKDYEVLLSEQNGKLQRILHFEGFHDDQREYKHSSQDTMQTTQQLVDSVKRLMATPMSEKGRLSEASMQRLQETKEVLQRVLEKL